MEHAFIISVLLGTLGLPIHSPPCFLCAVITRNKSQVLILSYTTPQGLPTSTIHCPHLKSSVSLPVRLTLASLLFLTQCQAHFSQCLSACCPFCLEYSSLAIHLVHSITSLHKILHIPSLPQILLSVACKCVSHSVVSDSFPAHGL